MEMRFTCCLHVSCRDYRTAFSLFVTCQEFVLAVRSRCKDVSFRRKWNVCQQWACTYRLWQGMSESLGFITCGLVWYTSEKLGCVFVTSTDRPFSILVFHFILYFLFCVLKSAEVQFERVAEDALLPFSIYVVGSKSFRTDIQNPGQMENDVRDI